MTSTQNALHLIVNASPVVQAIMAILAILSLLSWYAIFSKYATLRRAQATTATFEREFLSAKNVAQLFQGSLNNRAKAGSMERIFVAGMQGFEQANGQNANARLEFAQRSMKATFQREIDEMETKLPFLASVGSVSPYIGLLGTVWGIMNAFIGLADVDQVTLATVAPGIAEALIATAIGLFAAIPAVLAFNHYTGKGETVYSDRALFAEEMVALLQRQSLGETKEHD